MAVKNTSGAKDKKKDLVKEELLPAGTENTTEIITAEKTSVEKPADKPDGFCVYIGPSIRGVIQSGTIYGKSLKETKEFLAPAIKKYPLIEKLISTDKTFAEDRIKVKTAGNLLNVNYKKLVRQIEWLIMAFMFPSRPPASELPSL